jgi:HSP20 family protein
MAQWDPFRELEALRREIDRAFEEFGFSTEPFARGAFLPGRLARSYPLVNLHEDRDHLYAEAVAPGVEPNSLKVTVANNTLTIAGEKTATKNGIKTEAIHREERAGGNFVRTITLPVEVDEGKISAEYKNGLLMITMPKAEKAKPKQISVRVG